MYGNIGTKDAEVINRPLANLRKGALVVNLGCGSNLGQLHELACTVGRYQFDSTLILADLDTRQIENFWAPRPSKIDVVKVDAAKATSRLGKERADLVLTFGLFRVRHVISARIAVIIRCRRSQRTTLLDGVPKIEVSNRCVTIPKRRFWDLRVAGDATGR